MTPSTVVRGSARVAAALFLAAAIGMVFSGCGEKKPAAGMPPNVSQVLTVTARGEMAPEFTWKGADGAEMSFEKTRGRVTLVNFWATWCGPCKKELPDLVELDRAYRDRGFAVLGVSTDRTPNASDLVAEFVKKYSIPYQVLLSTEEMETAFRNVRMMPTSFLVDRDGKIVQTLVGIRTKAQLEELILPLL
jgi:cytochrome c biogenesis protein CcmG/thiol:disulfide interchange protein DsbE